jgi:hypothetical protein
MSNNFSPSEIKFTPPTKPTIKVRIPSSRINSKAEADLILAALARLTARLTIFEELFSEFLRQQKYSAIRERERRW